jgi:FlaA1/EpsC-like NDP-sugar epimerase
MLNQLHNRNFYILLAADLAFFTLSLALAYAIRFTFNIPADEWAQWAGLLPWALAAKVAVFMAIGVYGGMWRYTSIPDAIRLGKASILATLVIMTGLTLANRFDGYPRSVFLADFIFTLFFCGGLRVVIRLFCANPGGSFLSVVTGRAGQDSTVRQIRLLIIGAGDAAASIIREIHSNHSSPYDVVCCLDDDAHKQGRHLLDVPVRGPIARLPHLAKQFQADEMIIAMPSVTGESMRLVIALCKSAGIPFKTLPSISSLVDGRATVNDVREVNYEDLLGRAPVRLNSAEIGNCLTGKIVAVTGAGGSIGSELCRQIIRFKPASLVLIEANEFNLYRIEKELRLDSQAPAIHPAMGRVQDRTFMQHVFRTHRPQVVYHAAACKHVPMVEANPREGILTNVVGSCVAMDVAGESGVERYVQVSTDKAVRPTNVMGACKRMTELVLQSRRPSLTRYMAVRFGNVLGSSGSVIPLFQEQIRAGGPVTITHPDMTRYFMTIPEACQLILQAGAMGEGGEIFILEMGTPVKIADMARDMIRLSGKSEQDIEIVYTGLRPGEKLFEELITQGEGIVPTGHEKIMVLRRHETSVDPLTRERLVRTQVERLVQAAETLEPARIRAALRAIIPEYTPAPGPEKGSIPDSSVEAEVIVHRKRRAPFFRPIPSPIFSNSPARIP